MTLWFVYAGDVYDAHADLIDADTAGEAADAMASKHDMVAVFPLAALAFVRNMPELLNESRNGEGGENQ